MSANITQELRAYINERGVSVPAGATALDAVRALFPHHADDLESGTARLTDSRGLPVDHTVLVTGGAIFRVLPMRDKRSDMSVDDVEAQ